MSLYSEINESGQIYSEYIEISVSGFNLNL